MRDAGILNSAVRYEILNCLAGIEVFGGLNADFTDFFRFCLEILLQ